MPSDVIMIEEDYLFVLFCHFVLSSLFTSCHSATSVVQIKLFKVKYAPANKVWKGYTETLLKPNSQRSPSD
jgi:hypothetical protein